MSNKRNKRSFNEHNSKQSNNTSHSNKRRKYNNNNNSNDDYVDILPLIKCNKPRSWTVSIAISGSVMNTASTPQLKSFVSQFARIISIFCIDEIIIFSEKGKLIKEKNLNLILIYLC